MSRYPRYARRPRKSSIRSFGFASLVGEDWSFLHRNDRARKSHSQRYKEKNEANPTRGEAGMRAILRDLKYAFESQAILPTGGRIVDFLLKEIQIAIEVDGASHDESDQQAIDREKESVCEKNGIRVIRFSNYEVLHQPSKVRRLLKEAVHRLKNQTRNENTTEISEFPKVFSNFDEALQIVKSKPGKLALTRNPNGGWLVKTCR